MNELMRTAEGRDRNDSDEEMRQDKRARVEMDVGDGHDKQRQAMRMAEQQCEKCRLKSRGVQMDSAQTRERTVRERAASAVRTGGTSREVQSQHQSHQATDRDLEGVSM